MSRKERPGPAALNRRGWNATCGEYQRKHGASLERTAAAWGVWRVPEAEVGALGDVAGRDVLELGCGAAQWSSALDRAGARIVGLDLSEGQLAHARRRLREGGRSLKLLQAAAERLPFSDRSFDVVFCDHGAMSFADPTLTVPQVARVLRPGGRFVFCMSTPWRDLCAEDEAGLPTERLAGDYFELASRRDGDEVTFQLPYGGWVRLFRRHGLSIEDLIELRPPAGARTTFDDYAELGWSRRWPADHIWTLVRSD